MSFRRPIEIESIGLIKHCPITIGGSVVNKYLTSRRNDLIVKLNINRGVAIQTKYWRIETQALFNRGINLVRLVTQHLPKLWLFQQSPHHIGNQ